MEDGVKDVLPLPDGAVMGRWDLSGLAERAKEARGQGAARGVRWALGRFSVSESGTVGKAAGGGPASGEGGEAGGVEAEGGAAGGGAGRPAAGGAGSEAELEEVEELPLGIAFLH